MEGSTAILDSLDVVHRELQRALSEAIRQRGINECYSDGTGLCSRIDSFVRVLCRLPGAREELERRATFVVKQCASDTDLGNKIKTIFAPYGGENPKPRPRSILNKGPLPSGVIPPADQQGQPEVLTGFRELLCVQSLLTRLLRESSDQSTQDTLDGCDKVLDDAKGIRAEGCEYLFHVHAGGAADAPEVSRGWREVIVATIVHRDEEDDEEDKEPVERAMVDGGMLQPMREAADSLRDWATAVNMPATANVEASNKAKLSPRDLADKHSVGFPALRTRLDRWRCEHDAGYAEVSNAKRNEPKYLYDESAVMPIIDAMKAKSVAPKRAANVQRKKV